MSTGAFALVSEAEGQSARVGMNVYEHLFVFVGEGCKCVCVCMGEHQCARGRGHG